MKTRFIPSLFFLLILSNLYSQTSGDDQKPTFKRNAIYTELAGNGILYSINYEQIVLVRKKLMLSARLGVAVYPGFNSTTSPFVPLEICGLTHPKQKSHFEFGIGNTFIFYDYNQYVTNHYQTPTYENHFKQFILTGRIGYRYQRPEGGFVMRVGILPALLYRPGYIGRTNQSQFGFFSDAAINTIIVWGGVSLGYSFGKNK